MRLLLSACLAVAVCAPPASPAEPTLAVELKSIDGLLADVKYLAETVDKADQAAQIDGLIRALAGPNGLAGSGIDTKRPFGFYVVASPGGFDSAFALLLPVSNRDAWLTFLDGFNVKADKSPDGSYTLDIPNAPLAVYARFAHDYVYLTAQDADHVAPKALVAPADLFTAGPDTVAALTARIDRIPDVLKQIALSQVELQLVNAKDDAPKGETPEQAAFRKRLLDFVAQQFKLLLTEGRTLHGQFVVGRPAGEVSLSVDLDALPGTTLATWISLIGKGQSRFAVPADSAFRVGTHAGLPELLRPAFGQLIEAQFRAAAQTEPDPKRRQGVEKLLTAIAPTLKNGQLDVTLCGRGPAADGQMTAALAVQVREGSALESAVKQAVPLLVDAQQLSKVHFDAARFGDLGLHKIEADLDAEGQRVFGKSADLWIGFRPEAMVLAIGPEAQNLIRQIATAAAEPAPVAVAELSMGRLYPLDREHHKTWKRVAAEVFGAAPNHDQVRARLAGGEKLSATLSMQSPVLKFLARFDEAKANAAD